MIIGDHIMVDPEMLGGTPVLNGTRIPVQTLLDHVEHGAIEDFLTDFPPVTREQVNAVLKLVNQEEHATNNPVVS